MAEEKKQLPIQENLETFNPNHPERDFGPTDTSFKSRLFDSTEKPEPERFKRAFKHDRRRVRSL